MVDILANRCYTTHLTIKERTMLTPSQKQLILQAIAQIHQADADQQFALPAGDLCYAVHNKLEDAAEMLEELVA